MNTDEFSETTNIILPCDNELEIPSLSRDFMGNYPELPACNWKGPRSRAAKKANTWHFYEPDKEFTALKKRPGMLLQTTAPVAIEPNFSLDESMPIAFGLQHIYFKRWIAAFWQQFGERKIIVDMYVPPKYQKLNLVGVPKGWKAYSTRGIMGGGDVKELLSETLEIAREHAETKHIYFSVFAGGKKAAEWCRENGAVHLPIYRQ